jgi:acyl-CoA reductase-like NAD-dependent aldehyde dehydrogenase
MKWSEEKKVLGRANALDMGIGASVWSKDFERATRMAHQLEAGTV